MKKGLEYVIGCISFIALMASGIIYILSHFNINVSFLGTIKNWCSIAFYIIALLSGWIWLRSTKMSKGLKLFLSIVFLVFAVLSIIGVISL